MSGFENQRALVVCAVSTPEQDADDKESMRAQERDGLAWCEKEFCEVIDVVRIPGFSRSFLTFRELMEAAEAKGEFGPTRFWEHLQSKDFDVMVVRATNRFNREQSLNSEVMARVIRAGATIYSFIDGHIHKGNYRGMSAITGYRDSVEIDEFKKKRVTGIIGRAKKGLPVSGNPPMSHRVVFDPATGEELRLELREEFAALWHHLAAILLENVPYLELERELFKRWGFGRGNRVYPPLKMHWMLFNAMFWGNNVIRWQDRTQPYWKGVWIFDPSIPAPDGVEMFWDTHEPVYTGELAELIKAELRRRTDVKNGMAKSHGTSKFTGLVACERCHNGFAYARRHRGDITHTYLVCSTTRESKRLGMKCENTGVIREERVQEWLNKHLKDWLKKGLVDIKLHNDKQDTAKQLKGLRASSGRLENRLSNLLDLIADADDDLRADYRGKIRTTKDELERCKQQLQQLEAKDRDFQRRAQIQSIQLKRIEDIGLEAFWQLEPLAINQALRALLDYARLVVDERHIIGFVDDRELTPPSQS